MYIIFATVAVPNLFISVNIRVHAGTQMALVMDEVLLREDFFQVLRFLFHPPPFSVVLMCQLNRP
jgi:hypothetical protein